MCHSKTPSMSKETELSALNVQRHFHHIGTDVVLRRHGTKVVITGDSLSYNRYDFDPEPRTNAYDCLPGIHSWSFLLRDWIHRQDGSFRCGDELELTCAKPDTQILLSAMPEYTFPYDNRSLTASVFDREEELTFTYAHLADTDTAVLHLGSVPGDTAAAFDIFVDGRYCGTVDNNGAGQPFQGYNPISVELQGEAGTEHRIALTNWRQSANVPHSSGERTVHVLGIGSRHIPVHLTGQGGRTAQWLLDNLGPRVTSYDPDLVVLIIGANDRMQRTVRQFDHELREVVRSIFAANPLTRILLIAPPSSANESDPSLDDGNYVPDDKAKPYNDTIEAIAVQFGCGYLDSSKLFADIPVDQWRFDSVHFTKFGNMILAQAVAQLLGLNIPGGFEHF